MQLVEAGVSVRGLTIFLLNQERRVHLDTSTQRSTLSACGEPKKFLALVVIPVVDN